VDAAVETAAAPWHESNTSVSNDEAKDRRFPTVLAGWREPSTSVSDEEAKDWRSPTILVALLVGGLVLLGGFLDENFTATGLYKQGYNLQKENKCSEAIEKYDGVIRRSPKNVDAWFNRGICHYRVWNYPRARDDYQQVIQLKPDFVEAHYNIGLVHLAMDNTDQALGAFDNAIRLKPDEPDAHRQRGDILRDRGDLAEALAEYTTLVKLSRSIRHVQRRALVLRDMGEFDQAIAEYDRLISPTNPFAQDERAATLREKGDIEAALAELNASLQRQPDFAGGYIERGLIELIVPGQAAAAARDFAKALEVGDSYRQRMFIFDGFERYVADRNSGLPPTNEGPVISPNLPFKPAAHYLVIRLHVARQIAGEDDTAEYPANLKTVAAADRSDLFFAHLFRSWPGPIINLFRGTATPDDVRKAVRDTKAAAVRRRRECEADFYLAEFHLQKGEKDKALPLLVAAAAQCPLSAPERDLAKAELKRLS
jgi:tetratricopeptide (TPR) repeat protein